jgi:hypothetical protein
MPETKWEKLDPRVPVQRAEDFLHLVGDGWAAVKGRVEKVDPTFHQPLFDPAMVPTPGPTPEPVPPPSEQMLRDMLRTALAAEQETKTTLDNAQAAHERAKALVKTSSQELVKFDCLEAEIAAETTEALRAGSGRYTLPDGVKDKLVAREVAKAAWAAADTAEQQLADDLAQARDRVKVRQQITHAAMLPLLAQAAQVIVADIHDHEAKIVREQSRLMGFDMLSASHPAAMPGDVRDYIFTRMHRRIATPSEVKSWQDACEQLRADPDAQVVIQDPAEPPPAPSLVIIPPVVAQVRAHQAEVLAAREAEAQAARDAETSTEGNQARCGIEETHRCRQ